MGRINQVKPIGGRLEEITELDRTQQILNVTNHTAKVYGNIKEKLHAKGKPILENDIWIAALAKEYDLIVLTRDHHFQHVDDLVVEQLS